MDQITEELLSRYLDGDLDEREVQEFELRLSGDEELQKTLASMRSHKEAIAQLATSMEPPHTLDALMEPLRRSRPNPRGLHHAYGFLAAAATIVIGIGIAFELQRRNPQPVYEYEKNTHVVSKSKKDGYYQLQALPTAVPGEELLGATEHLLAEPKPELPEAEDPPALVVVGPLSEEEVAADRGGAAFRDSSGEGFSETFAPVPESLTASSAQRPKAARMAARSAGSAEVVIDVDGDRIRRAINITDPVPPGRYALRLRLVAGYIAECESRGGTNTTVVSVLCPRLIGLGIDARSDSSVDAEMIIQTE